MSTLLYAEKLPTYIKVEIHHNSRQLLPFTELFEQKDSLL